MHGDDLTPHEERLLREPPPARALRWCEAVTGGRVVAVRALAGGTASAVHALDVRDADGGLRPLVLRRFVRADWLAAEPGIVLRETAALELLAGSPLPTPELVAADPAGVGTGVPAVLMTRLPGAIVWNPADRERFLRGLAALLPAIHATPVAGAPLPAYEPYALGSRRPPRWSRRQELWERAFALFDGPAPSAERGLIHRDFHPGNVLWAGGEVSGVIDWTNASIGPPVADVGHCRWNLARALGVAAAERFLELTDVVPYDAYWDVVALLGDCDAQALERKTPSEEEFLALALSRQ